MREMVILYNVVVMEGHTDKVTFYHKPEGNKETIPTTKWCRQREKYRGICIECVPETAWVYPGQGDWGLQQK